MFDDLVICDDSVAYEENNEEREQIKKETRKQVKEEINTKSKSELSEIILDLVDEIQDRDYEIEILQQRINDANDYIQNTYNEIQSIVN